MRIDVVLRETKCPICGKVFIPAPQHIYKGEKGRLVCSWGCVCKYEREREKKTNKDT